MNSVVKGQSLLVVYKVKDSIELTGAQIYKINCKHAVQTFGFQGMHTDNMRPWSPLIEETGTIL